ncbi:glycosyltransferase family 4 protein [Ectobacillus ponti]|uniref:Glycosyltransferase family 4 protein n=1 Tax=Ectobacillus ponti TaxID=2961894 RepID=A0AA41X878_9BACI|nr:glycosyltransferase family 4 protein [Ectobacillus ponti]MCP8970686.1 glycosyltransferase family 4 protein [Ectobacillus ponti]
MKILITTVFEYPHTGGLSTHVQTLKNGLEGFGHTVDVISFSDLPEWKQVGLVKGPSFLLNKMKLGKGFVHSHLTRQKLLAQYIRENNRGYDIVNAQDVFATLASVDSGIPTVSTVHGYMSFEAISKGSLVQDSAEERFIREIEVEAYTRTRKNITVDQRIKDYLRDAAGIDAVAIKNFINVTDFAPEKNRKNEFRQQYGIDASRQVLFVPRRLTRKNGVIYPTLAMEQVVRQFPDALLLYAGTGEEESTLRSKISELRLSRNVQLLGAVPHEQMKHYYALSDIVLVPSVHDAGVEEATSISALEAMGSGSPLIACAVGGLKEIVNPGVDGVLVEEKNVDELAAAITDLLANPAKGEEFAGKARAKIENEYSHVSAARKYEEIYKSVL